MKKQHSVNESRRQFIEGSILSSALLLTSQTGVLGEAKSVDSKAPKAPKATKDLKDSKESFQITRETQFPADSFTIQENTVRFYSTRIKESVKLMVLADTHLFRDDDRGKPYRQYSERMAGAYHQQPDSKSGKPVTPEESLNRSLREAKTAKVNAVTILGDFVSFPSESGVEWSKEQLEQSGLDYHYIAGNHDWHYEGLTGTEQYLREVWTEKRLLPLYRGRNPLMYAVEIKDITILMIDDSIYEILPEQLDFLNRELAKERPTLLMMHIPLYAPGRSVAWGCGHPQWSAQTDRSWKIERRLQWPESGHTDTTMEFYRKVLTSPNLLGVFTGHIHRQTLDVINGKPQFVTAYNAAGNSHIVEIVPMKQNK